MLATREDLSQGRGAIEPWERDATAHDGASECELNSPRMRRSPRQSRRYPLVVMGAGLIVLAIAAVALLNAQPPAPGEASVGTRPPAPAPASSGVTLGGPGDVAAQMATYAPGQSSGWHTHTGLHAVVVLAGTLTIVDGECRPHTYGPGDSYVGGGNPHLAVNHAASPLEMAVTYMFPAGVSHTAFHVPAVAPAGCVAG